VDQTEQRPAVSTNAAPAVASLNDKLRVVFVANNSTNELLQSTFDDGVDVWTDNTRLNLFSRIGPSLQVVGSRLFVYFMCNPFLAVADIT
jgi:hypothetical protein